MEFSSRGDYSKRTQTVLRAAEEPETTQEDIQDWLQLDEGDPGFQLLTYLLFIYIGTIYIIICSSYLTCKVFFKAISCVINRMTSVPN
jgi:hypothetical protein